MTISVHPLSASLRIGRHAYVRLIVLALVIAAPCSAEHSTAPQGFDDHASTIAQPGIKSLQPGADPKRRDISAQRADANSQLAHRQLVEKARRGGIDLYFVGDSITRRWGCSDPEYADLLANWKANFFGWNAGNFGWGGDTTQNILWRLENGELDGVNPKVIVILAGTNNVGTHSDRAADVADITKGIKAILNVCQKKAPTATIILTAIMPRNDKPDAMKTIDQVNANIEKFADGEKIRFLDVNDKLANKHGQLFDGMLADKLHPTVKGYQAWADGLKPILTELLGRPATIDRAPPPTGDPAIRSADR